jgi:hypothetical protein
VVADLEPHVAVLVRHAHVDRRAGRRVDERVAQQVAEHLTPDRRRRAPAQARRSERRSRVGRRRAPVVDGVAHDRAQVHPDVWRRRHLVEPRERQPVLDQHPHPRRLVLDAPHRLLDVGGLAGRAHPELFPAPPERSYVELLIVDEADRLKTTHSKRRATSSTAARSDSSSSACPAPNGGWPAPPNSAAASASPINTGR